MSLINKFQRKTQMNRSLKVDMTSIFQGRDKNLGKFLAKKRNTQREFYLVSKMMLNV